ncbi:MAG: hypothetical protein AB7V56_04105 [Candidatus Nitrosocosmicus sp.]|uniref:hypothetical protein n=1 Tax=Candidatus Nitrosocosmicus agrestis TaxID=2563600 RepID=UPI00122E8D6A|nr:hypothetical protein [Candidatus Nitrosocosmicus sp. SS]KAA2280327.1 hypothetical protein F1Z66_11060 [Candidatus Nitrosocosmicus sp. SS]KAF0867746.1 hypothetical protein E5N71_13715 [Candidatus Nitrosocosmicus sp. SS]MDR4491566.1 hypothetical protein [Candidatus Nitrosocosmicus sp.]
MNTEIIESTLITLVKNDSNVFHKIVKYISNRNTCRSEETIGNLLNSIVNFRKTKCGIISFSKSNYNFDFVT